MKRYLLTAGCQYYPQRGDGDWLGFYDTYEEASSRVSRRESFTLFERGPRKGQVKETSTHDYVDDVPYDWVEIIDLQNWTKG